MTEEIRKAQEEAWDKAKQAAVALVANRAVNNARQRDAEGLDSEDWAVLNRGVFVLQNAAEAVDTLENPYRSLP